MGSSEFETLRADAYLINVSWGAAVDEGALIEAIEGGEISGAALDVFEREPLPPESPLWDFEEVIISPHRASATNRYHLDIAAVVSENVQRYRADEELRNWVA